MRNAIPFHRIGTSICASIFSLVAIFVLAQPVPEYGERVPLGDRDNSVPAISASMMPPFVVIGFVGGFIRPDDPVHSEVHLAARLRKAYPSGVAVETFESYHGDNARKKLLTQLDTDHDRTLSPGEKQNAHIILYGHSWGGSAAVAVARELEKVDIPVLLIIQVDCVSWIHDYDAVICANVAQAANFYQPDGLVHGQSAIRAADPARTKIIGNFRFDYKTSPYNCTEYPWYDRVFVKPNTQIDCNPTVWKQAESLIRANLPPET
jgi:hypothetical protein